MDSHRRFIRSLFGVVLMVFSMAAAGWTAPMRLQQVDPQPDAAVERAPAESVVAQESGPAAAPAARNLILSYAAKFVCTEALQPGQFWYGSAAPIVQQKTDVLIHNPNAFSVTLYKKAVRAPVEDPNKPEQGVAPGKWNRVMLGADRAFRIDCDDIAKLLTGDPSATFRGTYGVGATVEGFVVVGIGQQPVPGSNLAIFGQLDVTAEYTRSSEVLKKDIHYQPWWVWWWWSLPWTLGYPYQRILPITATGNIDCRGVLQAALADDAREALGTSQEGQLTLSALEAGGALGPHNPDSVATETAPALVALIGRCDKIDISTMSVDYVLVSNKGPTDPDPRQGGAAIASQASYPWIPGRWYDLALVTPQNLDIDIHDYFRTWQAERWKAAGGSADQVQQALHYYFPYWCGWGYWWWWRGNNCIDVGVGEGESIDVESITPIRVFMSQWPPTSGE